MARVIAVPGLAVRAYVAPPVQHLRNHGYDATLLQPPAWRGVDQDLELYGRHLAADIETVLPDIFRGSTENVSARHRHPGPLRQGFDQLPRAEQPWSPLSVEEALRGLAATGLSVTT